MRLPLPLGSGAGLLLGLLLANLTFAQAPQVQAPVPPVRAGAPEAPPADPGIGVQRIEIYQGPNRYVDYVSSGPLTMADRLAVRDLQRSENDLAYLDSLQRLKHMYVNSELAMEPIRHAVQQELYGSSITVSSYTPSYYSWGWGGRGGYYPYTWNAGRYGYGGGFGGGFGGAVGGTGYVVNRSLANGMGNEGVMKNAIAGSIANDASVDYATAAAKRYEDALTRVHSSEPLRKALGMPAGKNAVPPNPGRTLRFPRGQTLFHLQDGAVVAGVVAREDAHWFVIRVPWGEVSVRKSLVSSYEPVPAAGSAKKTGAVNE